MLHPVSYTLKPRNADARNFLIFRERTETLANAGQSGPEPGTLYGREKEQKLWKSVLL